MSSSIEDSISGGSGGSADDRLVVDDSAAGPSNEMQDEGGPVVSAYALRIREMKRLAASAEHIVGEWIKDGSIRHGRVNLTSKEVYMPLHPSKGYQFCIFCGKHAVFSLRNHLKKHHSDKLHGTDNLKVAEQVSRGIIERMKKALMDFSQIKVPENDREWDTYDNIVKQMRAGGVPILMPHLRPQQNEPVEHYANCRTCIHSRECCSEQGSSSRQRHLMCEHREPSLLDQHSAQGDEGSSEVHPDYRLPPTFDAPKIGRHLLFTKPFDRQYTGGAHVHSWFQQEPDKEMMFRHEYDDIRSEYYEQTYFVGLRAQAIVRIDEKLKIWRRLITDAHPILVLFRDDLKSQVYGPVEGALPRSGSVQGGCEKYESFVGRFMLVVMRARRRFGQTVTIDDVIYSGPIIPDFFRILLQSGVTVNTCIAFGKAIISLYKFVESQLVGAAGVARNVDIGRALSIMQKQYKLLTRELRKNVSLAGIAARPKRKEGASYCVTRAIVEHEKVDRRVETIMEDFEKEGTISHCDYTFVMGALMAYVMHCSGTRNEAMYKMCYGSIVDVSEGDANLGSTGLIERKVSVHGRFHRIWIGLYPNPKQQHQMRESSTCRGGLFVIDEKSHRWLLHYIKLREFIIARHEIEEAHAAQKRFFLLYGGGETGTGSVRSTLTRFFSMIGCGDYVISCNTTRHSTAGLQFNAYVEAVIDGLEPAVKEIAQLAGHQQQTQLKLYNDNFADACVKAYQKLKQFADDEAKRFKEDVIAARKSVTIMSRTRSSGNQSEEDEEEEADVDEQLSSETSDTEDEGTLDPGYALPSTSRANRNDRKTVKSVRELRTGLRSSSRGEINADVDPYEFREEDPTHEHALGSAVQGMASSSKPSSLRLTLQERISRGTERTVVMKTKKSKMYQAEPTLEPHAQHQNTASLQSVVFAAEEEIPASSGSSSSKSMQQDVDPYEFREEDPTHEQALGSAVQGMASSSKPSSLRLTLQERIRRGTERTVVMKAKKSKMYQAEPTLEPHAQHQNTAPLQSVVGAAVEEIPASSGSSSSKSMQQDIASECRGISLHEMSAALLLQWVAEKSGLRHLVMDRSKRYESFDAYAASANVLGVTPTKEIFPHCVVIPFAGANQLCKLLWAAHHDAFRRDGTVVLMLESLIPARQATVLVLGTTIQADEPRTFSSCVAYESGDVGRCCPVARSLARWDVTISDEWRGANVQHLPVEDKNKWDDLLYKADCTIADVLRILFEQPWQL